jgi:hypothetical protein
VNHHTDDTRHDQRHTKLLTYLGEGRDGLVERLRDPAQGGLARGAAREPIHDLHTHNLSNPTSRPCVYGRVCRVCRVPCVCGVCCVCVVVCAVRVVCL